MVTPIWQMDTLRLEKDEVLNGEAEGEEAPQLDPGVGLGWQLHHRLFKTRREQGL